MEVVWGRATGRTELGAVDGALVDAGIGAYNLVELSSIVPPDATVTETGTHDRAYVRGTPVGVVLAKVVTSDAETGVAGLGWHLATEGGVFYEASGTTTATCRSQLEDGLADARDLRKWDWEPEPSFRTIETSGEGPAAGVVAAVLGPLSAEWI